MATRAQREVQNEAHLLAIRIEQTLRDELSTGGQWLTIRRLSERMIEIADRAMYAAAMSSDNIAKLAALTAGRAASESEAR